MNEKNEELTQLDLVVDEKYGEKMPFLRPVAAEEDFYKMLRGEKVDGLPISIDDFFDSLMNRHGILSEGAIIKYDQSGIKAEMRNGVVEAITSNNFSNQIANTRGRVAQAYTIWQMLKINR